MAATILHLSDIHYGNDFIPWAVSRGRGFTKRPSPEITDGLRTAIKNLHPDYVVVSGDFVNKARSASFAEAARYLRDLLTNAGVDVQSKVLIVPGNHDVGFLSAKSDETKRLQGYRDFLEQFYQDLAPEERRSKFVKRCDAERLIFLALDTTLKSLRPRAEGEIGGKQLTWATQQLDELKRQMGLEYDRYAKIAVMHHHSVPIAGESARNERNMQLLDAGGVMSLLIGNGFDVVLHGHKHVPHMSPVYRQDGGILTVVGAGTTLAPYSDQQGVFGNNFNVIEVNHNALEVAVTRYRARPDGSFVAEVGPTMFPLGKVSTEGFRTKKLRRVARVANNGDTLVITERSGILVTGSNRVRRLPVRFSTDLPGAEISEFVYRGPEGSTVNWSIENEKVRDGFVVFANVRTVQDGETSYAYEYKLKNGTIMSLAENRRSASGASFEEVTSSVASDVDELVVEIEFPRSYSVKPKVVFELNGVELDESIFRKRYSLPYDEITNTWKFVMAYPPIRHGISIRWDLPKEWSSKKV